MYAFPTTDLPLLTLERIYATLYITRGNAYVMHFKLISGCTNVRFLTPQSMASQPTYVESSYVEIVLFVGGGGGGGGYHDYKAVWQPSVGEVLLLQTRAHKHQRQQSSTL